MREPEKTVLGSLGERLVVAWVSAFVAAVSLVVLPVFSVYFLAPVSAYGGQIVPVWYALALSPAGLFVIGLAALAGFLAGHDRMVKIFSFFWGTHSFWSRVNRRMQEWNQDYAQRLVPLWITLVVFAVLLLIAWLRTS